MPYLNVHQLNEKVKTAIPSLDGREIFMRAFNKAWEDGKDEVTCFKIAWTVLKRRGYSKNPFDRWTKGGL